MTEEAIMAEHQDPAYLQGGSHTARNDRAVLTTLLDPAGGVRSPGSFAVTPASGLSVNVAAGAGWTPEAGPYQGVYHLLSDTPVSLPLSASDSTNDRIDLIVGQVFDAAYEGSDNSWQIVVIEGLPAPSPSPPVIPDRALLLAEITVGAGVSSISSGDIADLRPGGGFNTSMGTAGGGTFLPLAGGTMAGPLDMDGNSIGGLPVPTDPAQPATKNYADKSMRLLAEAMAGAGDPLYLMINNPLPSDVTRILATVDGDMAGLGGLDMTINGGIDFSGEDYRSQWITWAGAAGTKSAGTETTRIPCGPSMRIMVSAEAVIELSSGGQPKVQGRAQGHNSNASNLQTTIFSAAYLGGNTINSIRWRADSGWQANAVARIYAVLGGPL